MNSFEIKAGKPLSFRPSEADAAALNRLVKMSGCESFSELLRALIAEPSPEPDRIQVLSSASMKAIRLLCSGDRRIFVRSTVLANGFVETKIDDVLESIIDKPTAAGGWALSANDCNKKHAQDYMRSLSLRNLYDS